MLPLEGHWDEMCCSLVYFVCFCVRHTKDATGIVIVSLEIERSTELSLGTWRLTYEML
jgi:hypothetical protein